MQSNHSRQNAIAVLPNDTSQACTAAFIPWNQCHTHLFMHAGFQCLDTHLCSAAVHREYSQIWAATPVFGRAHEAKCKGTSQVEEIPGKRVWVNRYLPAAQCCMSLVAVIAIR